LGVEIQGVKISLIDARDRGIRTRFITEITKDDVSHYKELLKLVSEVRHLGGIKGSFYIDENEYLAPATFREKGKPASEIIYSNVKEQVHHREYIFDVLWKKTIPAQEKMKKLKTERKMLT
jgi:hypothetical protein